MNNFKTEGSLYQVDEERVAWFDDFLDQLESSFVKLFGTEGPKPGSAGERLLDVYYFRLIPRILHKHILCSLPSDNDLAAGASEKPIISIDRAGFYQDFAFATLETILDTSKVFKLHEDSPSVMTGDRPV